MAKEVKDKKENKRHFFKDFKAELKKVIWPTPKQVVNNTTAVITIVLITAIIVFVLDVVFETINTHGIDKLRSAVTSSETNNTSDTETNNVINDETVENETNAEEDSVSE